MSEIAENRLFKMDKNAKIIVYVLIDLENEWRGELVMNKKTKKLLPVFLCMALIIGFIGVISINAVEELPKTQVDLGDSFTARIIYPKVNRYIAVHSDNNVVIHTASTSTALQWKFEKQTDGSYKISNVKYNQCLDVLNASGNSGANVQIHADNGSVAQRWFIYFVDGKYVFRPATSENCVLDVEGGSTENLTNVQLYGYHKSSAQLFQIQKISASVESETESTSVQETSKQEETTKQQATEEKTTEVATTTEKVTTKKEEPTTEEPTTEPPRKLEYYNEYTTVASIKDNGGCGSMQGFAMGSTYAYCAKINSGDDSAIITKTNVNTGSTSVLKDTSTGSVYMNYLGHANDMCVTGIDGKSHLYVVTMKTGSYSLVKMKVDGTNITKVGNYTLRLDGADISMSGISVYKKTDTTITFLFKKGKTIYQGSVGINTNSGTIDITKAYKINTTTATINGVSTDVSGYTHQGFLYHKNKLYVPLADTTTNTNRSIILVYDVTDASGTVKADEYLSFRITSSTYSALFEIEGCGICSTDGKLYFNTNRRKTSSDTNHDAVLVFNGFTLK